MARRPMNMSPEEWVQSLETQLREAHEKIGALENQLAQQNEKSRAPDRSPPSE